jgi:hypothetical protein
MGKRADVLLFAAVTLICVVGLELGYRAVSGVPLWRMTDWRKLNVLQTGALSVTDYDPVVGWVAKPWLHTASYSTIDHGIRKNRESDLGIRPGAVLVVGDSFAAGSEVNDHQSWPAHLEELIGQPVLNGAVGGWGLDQMVLRIEKLRPLLEPKTVILSTQEQGILRLSYTAYGAPKPYFSLEQGRLVPHNQPVPIHSSKGDASSLGSRLIAGLSHSWVAAQLMGVLDPDYWLSRGGDDFQRIAVDDVDLACALLARVKAGNDAAQMRTLFVLQYGWQDSLAGPQQRYAEMVSGCARQIGIETVDTFGALRAEAQRNPEGLQQLYVKQQSGDTYGHMSDAGNRLVAGLVAAQLAEPPAESAKLTAYVHPVEMPGDGRNRVVDPEFLVPRWAGTPTVALTPAPKREGPRSYTISAVGSPGEHYLSLPLEDLPAGAYTLSFQVRSGKGVRARVQLLDRALNGVLADLDLEATTSAIQRLGEARSLRASITPLGDWQRVVVTASLPEPGLRTLLQLLDAEGKSEFAASGERLTVRALQVEAGHGASRYCFEEHRPEAEDGENLVVDAESLDTALAPVEIAALDASACSSGAVGCATSRRYGLEATGSAGEHYVQLPVQRDLPAGLYVVSLDARAETTARLRVQLLDERTNGAIADYDLQAGTSTAQALGTWRARSWIEPAREDGWRELTLTSMLPEKGARVLVQLLDAGGAGGFVPRGERVALKLVRLERVRETSRCDSPSAE